MEFQKEYDELLKIINELKDATNLPVDVPAEERQTPLNVEELEVLLGRTQEVIDKLSTQSESIAASLGMTKEELSAYVNKPENFGKEEWQVIEQIQAKADEFQKSLVNTLVTEKNEALVKQMTQEQKKQKLAGRRNWVPM